MSNERTFSIIKPDATKRNISGKIITRLEDSGLRVVAQKTRLDDYSTGRRILCGT